MRFEVNTIMIGDDITKSGDGCGYIEFINAGTDIAYVNKVPILPQGAWAPYQPVAGDSDDTLYDITFAKAVGAQRGLVMVRKFYRG